MESRPKHGPIFAGSLPQKEISVWGWLRRRFHMRPPDDDEPRSWWIASTAIPLVAAATGPLANVMSIVALVSTWRNEILSTTVMVSGQQEQIGINDPQWCIGLNAASLACGLIGNLFLLFNFTQGVRYIIALPASIILWLLATGFLSGTTSAIYLYQPPIPPNQVFSQGYWSAVIAAILYFILSIILLVNMLGYCLGHYPQDFALTDDQRTLILQTTMFMIWLAIGGTIFQHSMGISFANALYFSEVTVLTIGYGDITATNNASKGLILPYAVIGVVILGLVVTSISRFATEVTYDNVVKSRLERKRARTVERSIIATSEHHIDLEKDAHQASRSGRTGYCFPTARFRHGDRTRNGPLRFKISAFTPASKPQALVMKEERDRFNAMRALQRETVGFRRWSSLSFSVIAFLIVWCGGAAVFAALESIDYFNALYFTFISLMTIGYGDITPKSNPGRPFFMVWSVMAIPTMTILISKTSDTVARNFNDATKFLADWTILPRSGRCSKFLLSHPRLLGFLQQRELEKRIKRGFQVGLDTDSDKVVTPDSLSLTIGQRSQRSDRQLARQLAFAIRRTAQDVRAEKRKQYSYEEWVEFTRLIRFTDPSRRKSMNLELDESEYGLIEWDWIGEESPMVAEQTEPEWALNRLCESLVRYLSRARRDPSTTPRDQMTRAEEEDEEEPVLRKQRDLGFLDENEKAAASGTAGQNQTPVDDGLDTNIRITFSSDIRGPPASSVIYQRREWDTYKWENELGVVAIP